MMRLTPKEILHIVYEGVAWTLALVLMVLFCSLVAGQG